MKRRALSALAVLLAAAACARPGPMWARPGGSEADFQVARSFCESQASTRFPPFSLGEPGYFSTNQTHCTPTSAGPNCILIGPGYLPQARAENDVNERPRESAFRACMMSSGWREVGSPEEGEGIAALKPPRDPKWEAAVTKAMIFCDATMTRRGGKDDYDGCVMKRARELSGS